MSPFHSLHESSAVLGGFTTARESYYRCARNVCENDESSSSAGYVLLPPVAA
ncbi:MAG: hypothetical protein ACP6IT_04460 [Candidatus Thorarchaeota archaeon]